MSLKLLFVKILLLLCITNGFCEEIEAPKVKVVDSEGDNFFKKERYDLMGIPFLKFRTDFGLGGGAKVSLFDYGDGTSKPFVYNLQLQYFATSMGKKDHVLFFIAPNFLKRGIDFDVEMRYQSLDNSKYFGIGNESTYNKNFEIEGKTYYKSDRYYDFKRIKPRFVLNFQKEVGDNYKFLLGYGIQHTSIKKHYDGDVPKRGFIFEQNPFGLDGGYSNFIKIGLVHDTRNSIASPVSGNWTEFIIEFSRSFLQSDYMYNRYTLTDRRYVELFNRVVYAQRIIFEWMGGDPPFYEYSFLGGSATLTEGLGGDKSLRGYLQNRFVDKVKLITNSEIRYQIVTLHFKKERFDIFSVGFWDMGRVYSKVSKFNLYYMKYTYGGGLRLAWNKFFVGRFDIGISKEGYGVNVGFANIF